MINLNQTISDHNMQMRALTKFQFQLNKSAPHLTELAKSENVIQQ